MNENSSDPEARVVIGYEDFDSGVRAMEMYKRVMEGLLGRCDVRIWKFEPLGVPELLAEAIDDVSDADVLIISVAGDRPLPLEAVEWVERAGRANLHAAILFVTDPQKKDEPAAALASKYLQEVARKRNTHFFTAKHAEKRQPVHFQNRVVEEAVLHSDRHDRWGLNE